MFQALHPTKNQMISVPEYWAFSADAGHKLTRDADPARCPVCKRAMRDRAGATKDDAHFYHINDLFCPTKEPNNRPYLGKPPRQINASEIASNRAFVAANFDAIYSRLHDIVPCLDFKEFISMLAEAKRLNAYGYAGLNPEYFPYVLVTLMNFLPSSSYNKSRKLKFIFFYDDQIKTYEQLWIDRGFCSDLIRVSYAQSVTKKVTRVETSTTYLTSPPSKGLSDKMKKWCLSVM